MRKTGKLNVAVLVGSLRKESRSLQMAKALTAIAPQIIDIKLIDLDLPLYNEDLETEYPPEKWEQFRNQIKNSDAVLFITPEYNRSVPAVLKNAIDVGSAPHHQNVFNQKPAAIISLSPGKMGAFGANHHLRQSLVFLNMPTMQQPEGYFGDSESLFSPNGQISNDNTRHYISYFLETFTEWIILYTK